ncbi:MAG: hypothetical protein JSU08_15465 [Acidobacteria bacterium]|nr:hypothetical protein [Acidobacteriota bacterium]
MWAVNWDGEFVVGGDDNVRLTPSFRLREFRDAGGAIHVHRELVSALQLLRDRLGRPLKVERVVSNGYGAVVSCDQPSAFRAAGKALCDRGVFVTFEPVASGIHVEIPTVGMPALDLAQALETAFSVTAAFETTGDRFQQITGNFDGAGLSFGPAQVNFGSGTLVPLFRKFLEQDEPSLRTCFSDPDDYQEFRRILDSPLNVQLAWASSLSTGRGSHDVVEPWKGYFQAVGRVPLFREITAESILRDYGGKAARAIAALERLVPGVRINRLRCVCALYDLVVQQGSLDKAWSAIQARVARERPIDQEHLVQIAVEERGRCASLPWRADAESRRVGILKGVPYAVADRQRANINFYLLRNVNVTGVDTLVHGDMSDDVTRVRRVLATGDTLLA